MALSNIFREPRREITEQLFGSAAIAAWVVLAYFVAVHGHIYHHSMTDNALATVGTTLLTAFLLAVAVFLAWLLVLAVVLGAHSLGEEICDGLKSAGFDPRPRRTLLAGARELARDKEESGAQKTPKTPKNVRETAH